MIAKKLPTTKSVIDRFTAEFQKVQDAQVEEAAAAQKQEAALEERLEAQRQRRANAENEIQVAATAIKNIGEMLGVQQTEGETD